MWHAECHNGLAASTVPAPIWYTHAHNTINGDSRICDKTFSMHACLTSQQSWQTSVTNLVEINHEGGEGQRNGLSSLDASEDLVHHADPGPLCRNKAANVCQEHYQTNLYWAGVLPVQQEIFTGQEHTTLSPLFVLHISFSSPAYVFFWTYFAGLLSPLWCSFFCFQTADLHDDNYCKTAKMMSPSWKDTEYLYPILC